MKKTVCVLIICVSCIFCFAQNPNLQTCINTIKNDKYLAKNNWSFTAYNCDKKQFVAQYNSDTLLTPASVCKIFSSAAAIDYLSEDYQYKTLISINENLINKNKYSGDIWIIGSGDPTIGLDYFSANSFIDSVYNFLKLNNIDTITGYIIGLSTCFDSLFIPATYPEDDYGNYYGAGTAGLIWNVNKLELSFTVPAGYGQKAKLKSIFPPFDKFNLNIKATAGKSGSGDNTIIWGGPFNFDREISGTLPPNRSDYKVYASSPDPALGFTLAVRHYLSEKGIYFSGECKSKYSGEIAKDYNLTYSYFSPKLKDIVAFVNTKSNNIGAESLLKTLGKEKYGQGTWENSYKGLNEFIEKNIGDTIEYKLYDGSGLSKANKLSTKMIALYLYKISEYEWFDTFYKSLPLAGKTGSLRTMFRGSNVEGKLRAKSGYMKTVRAYAGYVNNLNNERIAFSVIVNNYKGNSQTMKKNLEQLMISLSQSK